MKKYEVSVSIALLNSIFYSNSHTESSFIIKPAYCHNNDLNLKLNSRPDTVNYSIFNPNLEVCQQQASVKKQLIKNTEPVPKTGPMPLRRFPNPKS